MAEALEVLGLEALEVLGLEALDVLGLELPGLEALPVVAEGMAAT